MNRKPTGSFPVRRVAAVAGGACVTHGTESSAALWWTLLPQRGSAATWPDTSAPEVAVNLKKVVTWLVVAFVVFYVIQAPEASAQLVRNAGQALGNAASSFATFVGSLV
jgi:hypothetical protein